MSIETLFVLGFLVEAFVEYGKLIFVERSINWKQVAAMIAGIGLALLLNIDVFAMIGLSLTVPYAGVVLTGVLASRGSNWLADFIKGIQNIRGGGTASVSNE